MSSEITVALVAAAVALVGSIITLILGTRNIRIERARLDTDREHLKLETERLHAEVSKLEAETAKLRSESDDVRQRHLQIENLELELEKQKTMALWERRKDIYPEMLELVYHLRNQLRDLLQRMTPREGQAGRLFIGGLGEELYLLTTNLYKYRAFIDEDTFKDLHRYKRLLQDADVLLNRATRSPGDWPGKGTMGPEEHRDFMKRWDQAEHAQAAEVFPQIQAIFEEVDILYQRITDDVKKHIESMLERSNPDGLLQARPPA